MKSLVSHCVACPLAQINEAGSNCGHPKAPPYTYSDPGIQLPSVGIAKRCPLRSEPVEIELAQPSARLSLVRTYRVGVKGFPFDHVFVRAKSRGRARTICARAFSEAGYGTIGDGYKQITSTRLDDTEVKLCSTSMVEGMAYNSRTCPDTHLPCDHPCPDQDCARKRHPEQFA